MLSENGLILAFVMVIVSAVFIFVKCCLALSESHAYTGTITGYTTPQPNTPTAFHPASTISQNPYPPSQIVVISSDSNSYTRSLCVPGLQSSNYEAPPPNYEDVIKVNR